MPLLAQCRLAAHAGEDDAAALGAIDGVGHDQPRIRRSRIEIGETALEAGAQRHPGGMAAQVEGRRAGHALALRQLVVQEQPGPGW